MNLVKTHIRKILLPAMFIPLIMAAGDAFIMTREIAISGDFIRSDELGNVFVVKDNQLTKFDKSGNKLHSYSNLYAGDITFIDTHDPFKILVFYQPFGQLEFLDRTLSLISSSIDLNEMSLGLSTLACASYQGAFWVYDPTNFELVRINQLLEAVERSGNLRQVTGFNLNPNYMIERDNFLYLNDPSTGILIFDKYGTYFRTIPVMGLTSFQVFNQRIIYVSEDHINIYDTRINELSSTTLPMAGARSMSVCLSLEPQKVYVLGKEALYFFEIQ